LSAELVLSGIHRNLARTVRIAAQTVELGTHTRLDRLLYLVRSPSISFNKFDGTCDDALFVVVCLLLPQRSSEIEALVPTPTAKLARVVEPVMLRQFFCEIT
jgi:hypothetical protein